MNSNATFRLMFCLIVFTASIHPLVLAAQELTCDTTGRAWVFGEGAEATSAGACSDGPWSTPLNTFVPVEVGQFPIHIPINGDDRRPCGGSRMCWGGEIDNYQLPPEPATPSATLLRKLERCNTRVKPHTEFDSVPKDGSCFGHSFLDCWPAGCKVKTASLVIRMMAVRSQSTNDVITLFSGETRLFSSAIKQLPRAGGTWANGQQGTFVINLDRLPGGGSVLDQLDHGLDVLIQDDTKIDFMRLRVTFDCCARACGTKFLDENCNGLRDGGDGPLGGWVVTLSDKHGKARTVTTATDGSYCFESIQPGSYSLSEQSQTGWVQTSPPAPGRYEVELATGESVDGLDFGNRKCDSCTVSQATGACCTRNGCIQSSFDECEGELGGIWSGQPTCTDNVCDARGGACCTRQGCIQTLPDGCCDLGGLWRGDESRCDLDDCATPGPFGACVVLGSGCQETTFCECQAANGKWRPQLRCDGKPKGPRPGKQ